MAIVWGTINSYAGVHKFLADVVDVVYGVGEVAKITALIVFFGVPVVGKLNLRLFVAFGCEEYQTEPSLLKIAALQLFETQMFAVEL